MMQIEEKISWKNREIEKGKYVFDLVVAENFRGIIYRISALFFANDFSIEKVNVVHGETDWDFRFQVKNVSDQNSVKTRIEEMEKDIRDLLFERVSVTTYLIKKGKSVSTSEKKTQPNIQIQNTDDSFTKLLISAQDRPGILFQISQVLYLACVEIIHLNANTVGGEIKDEFHVTLENKENLDENLINRIKKNLLNLL